METRSWRRTGRRRIDRDREREGVKGGGEG